MSRLFLICTALLVLSLANAPQAARAESLPVPDSISLSVDFSDLDLNTRADWITARRRIHESALSICRSLTEGVHPIFATDEEACMTEAETNALHDLGDLRDSTAAMSHARLAHRRPGAERAVRTHAAT